LPSRGSSANASSDETRYQFLIEINIPWPWDTPTHARTSTGPWVDHDSGLRLQLPVGGIGIRAPAAAAIIRKLLLNFWRVAAAEAGAGERASGHRPCTTS
jgi:hypothetical protein